MAAKTDKFFKISFVFLTVVFLYLYHEASQNGRYTVERDGIDTFVFDTRRGVYYKTTPSGSVEIVDSVKGFVKFKKIPFLVKDHRYMARE